MKTLATIALFTSIFIGVNEPNINDGIKKHTSKTPIEKEINMPDADIFTEITDGAILGSVISSDSQVLIKATNADNEIKGTTNEFGEFFINGFPQGTYTVTIETNDNGKIQTQTFEDVEVNIGEVTALGTIAFE